MRTRLFQVSVSACFRVPVDGLSVPCIQIFGRSSKSIPKGIPNSKSTSRKTAKILPVTEGVTAGTEASLDSAKYVTVLVLFCSLNTASIKVITLIFPV